MELDGEELSEKLKHLPSFPSPFFLFPSCLLSPGCRDGDGAGAVVRPLPGLLEAFPLLGCDPSLVQLFACCPHPYFCYRIAVQFCAGGSFLSQKNGTPSPQTAFHHQFPIHLHALLIIFKKAQPSSRNNGLVLPSPTWEFPQGSSSTQHSLQHSCYNRTFHFWQLQGNFLQHSILWSVKTAGAFLVWLSSSASPWSYLPKLHLAFLEYGMCWTVGRLELPAMF